MMFQISLGFFHMPWPPMVSSLFSFQRCNPGETEGLVAAAQREEQKMQGANFPVIGQSRRVSIRLPMFPISINPIPIGSMYGVYMLTFGVY